jgi:hypothetical protein
MLQQKYSEKLQTALNLNIPVARFIPINNAAMNIPGEIVIEANLNETRHQKKCIEIKLN